MKYEVMVVEKAVTGEFPDRTILTLLVDNNPVKDISKILLNKRNRKPKAQQNKLA